MMETQFFSLLVVNCVERLLNPENGNVVFNSEGEFGTIATYSCFTGYNLIGDETRMCQSNRLWTGQAPICESKCLFLHKIHH